MTLIIGVKTLCNLIIIASNHNVISVNHSVSLSAHSSIRLRHKWSAKKWVERFFHRIHPF